MKKESSTGLVRALGPLTATAVVIGTTIGSGVFVKAANVSRHVEYFGLAASLWTAGGVLVALGALAYAEVAVLFPQAGGNYVFLREAYGRLPSFLFGWVEILIIRTASIAALATVFSTSLSAVLADGSLMTWLGLSQPITVSPWTQRCLTMAVILVLGLVNVRGVRWGGGLQFVITLVKISSLLAITVLPFLAFSFLQAAPQPNTEYLRPTWPAEWGAISVGGLGTAFLSILWAYHGWMSIAPVAEEVSQPQRNLPLSLIAGVLTIVFLYLGANLAYSLIIPRADMAAIKDNTTVAAEFGRRMIGPLGAGLAAAAVMISVFGALNGNLLTGPRVLYAMGADGLVPAAINRIHPRFHTPAAAIMTESIWSAFMVFAVAVLSEWEIIDPKKSHFDILTDFAMFAAILFETFAVITIFVFRWRLPNAERPYRCPGYPIVPALYVVLPCFIVYNTLAQPANRFEALTALEFVGVGAIVYFAFGLGRRRSGE